MKTPILDPKGRFTKGGKRWRIPTTPGQTHDDRVAEAELAGFKYEPRLFAGLKAAKVGKRQRINYAKGQADKAGFEFNGMKIRTGPVIRLALTAARLRADADPNYVYQNWQLADGTFQDMTAPEIIAIDDEVESFLQANSNTLAELFIRIDAATTSEELEKIEWP